MKTPCKVICMHSAFSAEFLEKIQYVVSYMYSFRLCAWSSLERKAKSQRDTPTTAP